MSDPKKVIPATDEHPAIYRDGSRLVAGKQYDAAPPPQEPGREEQTLDVRVNDLAWRIAVDVLGYDAFGDKRTDELARWMNNPHTDLGKAVAALASSPPAPPSLIESAHVNYPPRREVVNVQAPAPGVPSKGAVALAFEVESIADWAEDVLERADRLTLYAAATALRAGPRSEPAPGVSESRFDGEPIAEVDCPHCGAQLEVQYVDGETERAILVCPPAAPGVRVTEEMVQIALDAPPCPRHSREGLIPALEILMCHDCTRLVLTAALSGSGATGGEEGKR